MDKSTCRWPDCDVTKMTGWGLCKRHYHRAYGLKNFEDPWREWAILYPNHCVWPDCDGRIYARKLCLTHYGRATLVGTFDAPWQLWSTTKTCEYCGATFEGHRRNTRFCSRTCGRYAWRDAHLEVDQARLRDVRRRRRAIERDPTAERFTQADVRMHRGDICYLCGERIDFRLKHPNRMSPSLDHIVPLSKGGAHAIANVAMTHLACNLKKNANAASTEPTRTLFAT